MPRGNPSPKLAIIDPDVHDISAWMTMAARETLQLQAGLAAVAQWEKQHGLLTPQEMKEARRRVQAQFQTS